MKKRIMVGFLFLIMTFVFGQDKLFGQGAWKSYINALQEIRKGLTPFMLPNPTDEPGTIIRVANGIEHLVYSKKQAFPDLEPEPPGSIPSSNFTKISQIKFSVGAGTNDVRVLQTSVAAAASVAFSNNMFLTHSIKNPQLHRLAEGPLKERIISFDINNPRQKSILEELILPNTYIITGAIKVDGFDYFINRGSNIDASLEATLASNASSASITFKKMSEKAFSMTTNSPMFICYYIFNIARDEIKQIYLDKIRIKQLEENKNKIAKLGKRISAGENIKIALVQNNEEISFYRAQLESLRKLKEMQSNKTINEMQMEEATYLQSEIDKINIIISKTEETLDILTLLASKYDQEAMNLAVYEKQYATFLATKESENDELIRLRNKNYKIFTGENVLPVEIRSENTPTAK